jgi:hypothetical protein
VQVGVHTLFSPVDAKEAVGGAKFIHVWRYKEGVWEIARVISDDHGPVQRQ